MNNNFTKDQLLEGVDLITNFNNRAAAFVKEVSKKEKRQISFKVIFSPHLWEHLSSKYAGYDGDFGGFYVNLDFDCWERLLNYMFKGKIDLTYPPIPDWEVLAEKYDLGNSEEYRLERTEKNVRKLSLLYGDRTKWQVWPITLVWFQKWVIYACNHGIDGFGFTEEQKQFFDKYNGHKFGNWTNWSVFWNKATPEIRFAIVQKISEY